MERPQNPTYPIPDNEDHRLEVLHRFDVLDTPPDEAFDRITSHAKQCLNAPVSLVSLVDRNREWHKSAAGTERTENPREDSFCAHAITQDDPLIISDARQDGRFQDYPLVTGDKKIKVEDTGEEIRLVSYAGAPLIVEEDIRLGTLCVVDNQPRRFDEEDRQMLRTLSKEVVEKLQLRLKNKKLKKAKEEAEQANRAKSQFLARMSHDIRTPLNAISGVSDLLEASKLSPEQQEYVNIFKHASETLLNLINDILDLSKIEAGELELSEQVFRLGEFIDKSVSFLARQAHDKGIELVLDVDSTCPARVVGDPRRLQQIVVNLVGNAVKFTNEGEVILKVRQVRSNEDEATIQWEVEDTGPGIPEEDRTKIFQSYKQSRPSFTQQSEGTGLGLAISRYLVERMGGEIEVESETGEGSTFRFQISFPLPNHGQETESIRSSYREEYDSIHLGGKRILVVDDHRISRNVFRQMLEERGGEVDTASGGQEALELLSGQTEQSGYDFIILDRKMPDMDGFSVIEQINEQELLHKVVILVTSDDLKGDLQLAKEHGIKDYLLKPVSRRKLFHTLEQYLEPKIKRSHPGEASEIELPDQHDGDPPSLLIAEDNDLVCKIMGKYLQHRPVDVQFAHDGQEAVDLFESGTFDLVFMDLRMPAMDGLEAVQEIRRHEAEEGLDETPIVMLSGEAVEERKQNCMDHGCNDFVVKPIREEKILELIQRFALDT